MDETPEVAQDEKKRLSKFNVGDVVKVYIRITEGEKARTQAFEGKVIRIKGGGVGKTFTVRRVSYGEGIERIFPLHSPSIEKVDVIKKLPSKRAKLYYLRKSTK